MVCIWIVPCARSLDVYHLHLFVPVSVSCRNYHVATLILDKSAILNLIYPWSDRCVKIYHHQYWIGYDCVRSDDVYRTGWLNGQTRIRCVKRWYVKMTCGTHIITAVDTTQNTSSIRLSVLHYYHNGVYLDVYHLHWSSSHCLFCTFALTCMYDRFPLVRTVNRFYDTLLTASKRNAMPYAHNPRIMYLGCMRVFRVIW
jgi:hypothetical protein